MSKKRRNRLARTNAPRSQRPGRVATITQTHTRYSGPIPPAEALAAYAQIDIQLVDRIVAMAELEQATRHEHERMELQHIELELHQSAVWLSRGQWLGAFIGTCALGVAAYAISKGQSWVAGTAITSVAGMVGVFIWRARVESRTEERDDESTTKR